MGCIKWFILILLVGGTLSASVATFAKMGAENMEHPKGISLRDQSTRPGGFFAYYARSHSGGGLRGGK